MFSHKFCMRSPHCSASVTSVLYTPAPRMDQLRARVRAKVRARVRVRVRVRVRARVRGRTEVGDDGDASVGEEGGLVAPELDRLVVLPPAAADVLHQITRGSERPLPVELYNHVAHRHGGLE